MKYRARTAVLILAFMLFVYNWNGAKAIELPKLSNEMKDILDIFYMGYDVFGEGTNNEIKHEEVTLYINNHFSSYEIGTKLNDESTYSYYFRFLLENEDYSSFSKIWLVMPISIDVINQAERLTIFANVNTAIEMATKKHSDASAGLKYVSDLYNNIKRNSFFIKNDKDELVVSMYIDDDILNLFFIPSIRDKVR